MSNEMIVMDYSGISLTNKELETVQQLSFCKDLNVEQIKVFAYTAKRLGLNIILRQIHAVPRNGTLVIQVGIDGYRAIADRTGKYAPGPKPTFEYVDNDPKKGLFSATAYVKKLTPDGTWHIVEATAYFSEYAAYTKDGRLMTMWTKGHMMLAKCAEALALRKAFPAELSGTYTHEEMHQADNDLKAIEIARKEEDNQAFQEELENYFSSFGDDRADVEKYFAKVKSDFIWTDEETLRAFKKKPEHTEKKFNEWREALKGAA